MNADDPEVLRLALRVAEQRERGLRDAAALLAAELATTNERLNAILGSRTYRLWARLTRADARRERRLRRVQLALPQGHG